MASTVAQAPKPDPQVLHPRDESSYREISKAFDERQFKQAVKKADTLLKKYPNHGNTTAMKALCLNSMGKEQEAIDLAKLALRYNIKSHVCWQILGMIQKAHQNYVEAMKAYRQAWKVDPENFQIARDLAVVQMHVKDYQGYLETRQAVLTQKVNTNLNLFMFGYAHALAGNAAFANVVLDKFEIPGPIASGGVVPASNASSDVALYRLRLFLQGGDPKQALIYCNSPAFISMVVDRLAADEQRASLRMTVGAYKQAATVYWKLLATNQDNLEYAGAFLESIVAHAGRPDAIPAAGKLDSDIRAVSVARAFSCHPDAVVRDTAIAACLLLTSAYPRCRTLKRLLLDALPANHPLFRPCLAAYIRFSLRKGIPSLFSDVRHLGRTAHSRGLGWAQRVQNSAKAGSTAKALVLVDISRSYFESMQNGSGNLEMFGVDLDAVSVSLAAGEALVTGLLDKADAKLERINLQVVTSTAGDGSPDSPDVLPWCGLLLARLEDEGGDPVRGIATLEATMGHTPTVIELLMAKARLLKHSGKFEEAADVMDTARQLDVADRYVNNKAVEYGLRAGRIENAEATIALFVRHDAGGSDDPLAAMRTLQVSWYDLALGAAWEARGDIGPALAAYHHALAAQESFVEDGMDYHVYCLRSMWLNTHHDMLAVNQAMMQHSVSLRATEALARCYLKLHGDPALRSVKERPLPIVDTIAKPKKEEEKKKEEEEVEVDKKSHDSWGVAYVTVASPLETARKYARLIVDGTPRAWAVPASTVLSEAASGTGMVPVLGADIKEPSVMLGGRCSGWQTGLGALAQMYVTSGEVEMAAGKIGMAAAALQLAINAATTDPESVASLDGLQARISALKAALGTAAACAAAPLQSIVHNVCASAQ